MAEITGVDVAVGRHMERRLERLDMVLPTFPGLMAGYDTFYGAPIRLQRKGIKGGKMLYNYVVETPDWEGVDGLNPDYSQRKVNIVKKTRVVQGSIVPSSHQVSEPIDKRDLNALAEDGPFENWIMQIGDWITDKYLIKINEELFPAVNLTGNSQAYKNSADRLMAFSHALQSGYADNAPTGSGTFEYMGIDLNLRTSLKAINRGTVSSGWTLSEQAWNRDFFMPLTARGAKVDMVLCDGDVYAYMRQQMMSSIVQAPEKTLKYPGPKFMHNSGVWFIWEQRLDLLPAGGGDREMYTGDSSVLQFGWPEKPMENDLSVIKDWPEQPSAHLLQGYRESAFVNRRPSFWGRAYKVVIP